MKLPELSDVPGNVSGNVFCGELGDESSSASNVFGARSFAVSFELPGEPTGEIV